MILNPSDNRKAMHSKLKKLASSSTASSQANDTAPLASVTSPVIPGEVTKSFFLLHCCLAR